MRIGISPLLLTVFFGLGVSNAFTQQGNDAPKIRAIKEADPVFPTGADNFIYGDSVAVIVDVDKTGKVTDAKTYGPLVPCSNLKDKTAEAIGKAAVDAAKATVFEPIIQAGNPIEATFLLNYKLPIKNPVARDDKLGAKGSRFMPKPEYPKIARDKGMQSQSHVAIMVSESGEVISAAARTGSIDFIPAGVAAACRTKFNPSPAKVITLLTYTWRY